MKNLIRASRWIRIQELPVTNRSQKFDYAEKDPDDPTRGTLSCFRFRGRLYAMGQFVRRDHPIFGFDQEGKEYPQHIHAYDAEGGLNPLLLSLHPDGERVCLYEVAQDAE
jgi:hypothetical protein